MRTFAPVAALAAAVILGCVAANPAAAGALCDSSRDIKAAFEPRLDYEQERATRVAGNEADWASSIRNGFEQIDSAGLDCRAVYDRYAAFVEHVIDRNDRLEKSSPMTRGMIFRKW